MNLPVEIVCAKCGWTDKDAETEDDLLDVMTEHSAAEHGTAHASLHIRGLSR